MSEFLEIDRRAIVREQTHYRFARALINACLFVWLLGCAITFCLASARLINSLVQPVEWDAVIALGASVGSALTALFLGQLFHAFFDIADCSIINRPKP